MNDESQQVRAGSRVRYRGQVLEVEKVRRGVYRSTNSNNGQVRRGEPFVSVRVRLASCCQSWVDFARCELVR